MNKIKIAGLLVVMLMGTKALVAQTEAKEQLVVPLSSPGKPYSLKINLITGSIKASSYAGKDIIIEVSGSQSRSRREAASGSESGGMRRIQAVNGYEVTAKEDNNKVSVSTDNPTRSVNLSLKIPQDVSLKLSTVNTGNIEVENVRGDLEISNVNGAIKLANISGAVVANTVNGSIQVAFASVDPKAPMAFSTLNGSVDVTFPALTKANLKMKSDRGEIYSDFDMDVDKSQPKVNKTSQGGLYKLNVDDWVYGKINGGGSEVMMKNMNGNIFVRKAK